MNSSRPPDPVQQQELEDDELTGELLIAESPEGAPPRKPVRLKSLAVFVLVAVAVIVGVVGLLVYGGITSFGLGLVLCATLLVAAFPVWASALLRRGERRHAHEESQWLLRR